MRDGLGREVVADHAYYVQSVERSVDCAVFWRPDGFGYTADVYEAGAYLGADLVTGRGFDTGDIPWPVDWIQDRARWHIRVEDLRRGSPKTGAT